MTEHYCSWYDEFLNPVDLGKFQGWLRDTPDFLCQRDVSGDTPLSAVIDCGPVSFVQLCLEGGATPNAPTDDCGYTDMLRSIERGGDDGNKIIDLLLAAGAWVDGDRRIEFAQAPLILACKHGELGIAERLLGAGAGIDMEHDDDTALIAATRHGHVEIVRLLLEHKADTTIAGLYQSVLQLARDSKHPGAGEIVAMLVAAGAPARPSW